MKAALRFLPIVPVVASASTILGFEEYTGFVPNPNTSPTPFVGQPYSSYFTLTVNQDY